MCHPIMRVSIVRSKDATERPPVLKTMLVDLAQDIGEQRDLSQEQPARVKQLQKLWDDWNAQNVPAIWTNTSDEDAVPALKNKTPGK